MLAGLTLRVTSETTPPGRWIVWQTDGHQAAGNAVYGLIHSASYVDRTALAILGEWPTQSELASVEVRAVHTLE